MAIYYIPSRKVGDEEEVKRHGPIEPRTSDPALPHVKTGDHVGCLFENTRPAPNSLTRHSTTTTPCISRSRCSIKQHRTQKEPIMALTVYRVYSYERFRRAS